MWGIPNPFLLLGSSAASKLVAEAWTLAMMSLWGAGLWLMRMTMRFLEAFSNPDLSINGPARPLYQLTFWIALALMGVLLLCQFGLALIRRDGRTLGQLLWGVIQFGAVYVMHITWVVLMVAAASGFTRAFMGAFLAPDESWSDFAPFEPLRADDITDAVFATVIGFLGVFLVIAAIAYAAILVTTACAAVVVAVAGGPISAAGLVWELTQDWYWKSFRWFHAAVFTPAVVVLVMGTGVKFSEGIVLTDATQFEQEVAGAIIGLVLTCMAAFAPMGLFKLLAFVDPGTNSGAALRATVAASGGLRGLLSGGSSTSDAASSVDEHGRSQGERSVESDNSSKAAQQGSSAIQAGLGALSGVGGVAAGVLSAMQTVGTQAAVVGADVANQAGIGHNTYVPDHRDSSSGSGNRQRNQQQPEINGTGGPDPNASGRPPSGEPQPGPNVRPPSSTPVPTPG